MPTDTLKEMPTPTEPSVARADRTRQYTRPTLCKGGRLADLTAEDSKVSL